MVFGTFAMSASYATDGDTVPGGPASLGVNSLDVLWVKSQNSGWIALWNGGKSTVKVQFRGQQPSTATSGVLVLDQVASATDLSAVTVDYIAFGR